VEVLDAGRLALPPDCGAALAQVRAVGVRPEHWQLVPGDGGRGLQARVERVEWLGDVTLVHCRLDGAAAANGDDAAIAVKAAWAPGQSLPQGAPVRLHAEPRDLMLFDAQGRALAAA